MMKMVVAGALGLSAGSGLGAQLKYVIEPKIQEKQPYLEVTATFKMGEQTETDLILPWKWAGQSEYYKGVRNLKSLSPDVSLTPTKEPYAYKIKHKPQSAVQVRYQVFQYWDGPISWENHYRPLIQKDYIHFIGHGVFAFPDHFDKKKIEVEIEWLGLPSGWEVANSHGSRQVRQKIHVTLSELQHSVYTLGDFKIKTFDIKGKPLSVAARGKWAFDIEKFYELCKTIIQYERSFWNDFDFPYFLITLIPVDVKGTGGTGLTNPFALFVSPDISDPRRLLHVLAHEYFHMWNGHKIDTAQPEQLIYWFSEGFTDYYTRLLLLRAKLITLPEYVLDLNKTIKNYYLSPVRNASNQRVREDFWTNRDVEMLPYQRGDIRAHMWNQKIKEQGKGLSLDNLMFDLLEESNTKQTLVTNDVLDRMVRKYLPQGVMEEISRHEERGETVVPDPGMLGPCFTMVYEPFQNVGGETVQTPQFVLDEKRFAANPEACLNWFRAN
jgi:predicted metalloprotease with PDZ domain